MTISSAQAATAIPICVREYCMAFRSVGTSLRRYKITGTKTFEDTRTLVHVRVDSKCQMPFCDFVIRSDARRLKVGMEARLVSSRIGRGRQVRLLEACVIERWIDFNLIEDDFLLALGSRAVGINFEGIHHAFDRTIVVEKRFCLEVFITFLDATLPFEFEVATGANVVIADLAVFQGDFQLEGVFVVELFS